MSWAKICLSTAIRGTNKARFLRARGDTVIQILDDLIQQYPAIKNYIFNGNGKVRKSISFLLNNKAVQSLQEVVKMGSWLVITCIAREEVLVDKGRAIKEMLKVFTMKDAKIMHLNFNDGSNMFIEVCAEGEELLSLNAELTNNGTSENRKEGNFYKSSDFPEWDDIKIPVDGLDLN